MFKAALKPTLIALALCSIGAADFANACTGLIVGKKASATGSTIIARNEDYYINNWNKQFVIRPARTYKSGEMLSFGNGLKVPAPKDAMRYTAMPDWNASQANTGDGPYEEQGVNAANVAISATTSAEANDRVLKVDPFVENGIVESVIPSLILPQAKTAREAVALLGQYIEQYGAGEANGIAIADVNEAWQFEVGSGHQWIAVRIPDDAYVVEANGLRIHGINLNDTQNVMSSKGLYDFVIKNKLLSKPDASNFNFAKAFGTLGNAYNVDREWLGQHMLTPSKKQAIRQDQYPFLMKPDHPIGVLDIAKVLRATYKGTPLAKKGERPIGVDRTIETHIIEMRDNMPHELAALSWQSLGATKDSFFTPFYLGAITTLPDAYHKGSNQYSPDSAWWNYRMLTTLTEANGAKFTAQEHQIRNQYEKDLVVAQPHIDSMLKGLYKDDKAAALNFANVYSNGTALYTLQKTKHLNDEMMTNLTKSTEKNYTPAQLEALKKL